MHLLRRLNLPRFNFASDSKLRKSLPVRNGGTLCIPREIIEKYYRFQCEDIKSAKNKEIGLIPQVQAFHDAIYQDPVLRMGYEGALDAIPEGGILAGDHPQRIFSLLSSICINAPKFHNASITGVPFYALFIDFLDTRYGQAFFSNPIVNSHLKNIFNAYQIMLRSKLSLEHVNECEPYGWLCPTAQKFVDWNDYYVDKSKPHWGFQSWNDWFIRPIKPEARPIAPGKNIIVNSSDSYPLYYPSGVEGTNPTLSAKPQNKFWLKDNKYSLIDMLGARQMNLVNFVNEHFVGGTIYQAFLDPWCYHRWHAPISGTIWKSYQLGGTYYLDNPGLSLGQGNRDIENYIASQPMLSIVSVRQIYIIKLDDYPDSYVTVIEIGMAEVSSCHSTVIEGQRVEKGDQLGYFQFGGSSHVIIFDKNLPIEFNPDTFKKLPDGSGYNKVFVNSWLATIKK
jgi:phosphatidylserine decarboxylase